MEKKILRNYRVWFDQVNQTMFDVKAVSEEDAIKKARREWKNENGEPYGAEVEEMGISK